MANTIRTLNYGTVFIRKSFTIGDTIDTIELSDSGYAAIKRDWTTGQLFAVLLDENLKEVSA